MSETLPEPITVASVKAMMLDIWSRHSVILGATSGVSAWAIDFFGAIKGIFSWVGVVAGGTLALVALVDKINQKRNGNKT